MIVASMAVFQLRHRSAVWLIHPSGLSDVSDGVALTVCVFISPENFPAFCTRMLQRVIDE